MADNKDTISCPACGANMTKVYSDDAKVMVDICLDGCGGIFFDNREFEKFDEQHENADVILNQVKGKTFKKVEEVEVRICPVCDTPMVKQGAGKGGVEIDVCNVCGAKFLDNGELQKIRVAEQTENLPLERTINALYEENFANVAGNGKLPSIPHSAERRQFFETLVKNFI